MKKIALFLVVLTLIFSMVTSMSVINSNADAQYGYTIDSIKFKSLDGAELSNVPNESFSVEVVASVMENADKPQHILFAVYGKNSLMDIMIVNDFAIKDNKLTFSAIVPNMNSEADSVKAFIWDGKLNPLSQPGLKTFSRESSGAKVAPVTGISFEKRGVYVKMTLAEPTDKTGIVSYEALIYNKDNPEEAVHRSITIDNPTAHYRLDDEEIFKYEHKYNAIKVTSNGSDNNSSVWASDISLVPSKKDIVIDEALVVNVDEIDFKLSEIEAGYVGTIFTRKDGTVIDEDQFYNYEGKVLKYRDGLKDWSDDDKKALENGEVSVSFTGINITKMEPVEGSWVVEFERIKSPSVVVKCDVDIIQ